MGRAGSQAKSRNSSKNYHYIDGSAVRKLQTTQTEREHKRSGIRTQSVRRTKVKAVPMNKGYIAVVAAAFLIVCGVLMSYVKIQSDITNHINNISELESKLNELRLAMMRHTPKS